jgi:glycine/D-amino acid oxidase-like deaminating enzyme
VSAIVIGGGVAGLSCAWHLARSGVPVVVFEQEPELFAHASGRNAAIFRPLEETEPLIQLAERSRLLLAELRHDAPLLDELGLLLTASEPAALEGLGETARRAGLDHQLLNLDQITRLCPVLDGGRARHALFIPHGGALDLAGIATQLRRRASDLGAQFSCDAPVAELLVRGGAVRGVRLADGREFTAPHVVLAAGAWSQALAASVGLFFPLIPHRRHLALLEADSGIPERMPVVWDVELGSYFRREPTGLIACPGDHEPHPPGVPNVEPRTLAQLQTKLTQMAPNLGEPRIRQAWACLRTLTTDGHPVLGGDARLDGFHWLAGLGGHGMTVGLAAGELVARAIAGEHPPLLDRFAASRWSAPS